LFFSSLLVHFPLIPAFCHFQRFPLSHHTIGQTGSFLSFGYKHLWEALHVGHFPLVRTRKTGYSLTATRRAHSVGFLFNVVFLGLDCYLFAEHLACQLTMRYESRFNSPTQTGIECQQDTLSGDDKSYPRTSGMSVIAVLVLGSIGLAEKAGHGVETRTRQSCPRSQEVVLCLRSKRTCTPHRPASPPPTRESGRTWTVGSSPTLQASLGRSTPTVDPGT
jgi:hypothetical protein